MASMDKLNELLQWSTANTDTSQSTANPPQRMKDIDPGLVDMILGRPDAIRMKEEMAKALDKNNSVEDRVQALDDLELLVESVDNANDLANLKLWEPLISLVNHDEETEVRIQALWVAGTAVQNNPQAQKVFLEKNGIEAIIVAIADERLSKCRAKGVYALSSATQHNPDAISRISQINGWNDVSNLLSDDNVIVQRKITFLLRALLAPEDDIALDTAPATRAVLSQFKIIDAMLSSFPIEQGDVDVEENLVKGIVLYVRGGGGIVDKEGVRRIVKMRGSERAERWGLEEEDWKTLSRVV